MNGFNGFNSQTLQLAGRAMLAATEDEQMADIKTLENVSAKARWLRSCEKRFAVASLRDDIAEMNDLGRMVEDAKDALDRALQSCDV